MAHEDRYTPEQIRSALTRSFPLMEEYQAAAVALLLDYNHGRIGEDAVWLRTFVAMGAHGHKASLRWERLTRALSDADDIPADLAQALAPFTETERSVMRLAVDLGSDRWLIRQWDQGTRSQVLATLMSAITPTTGRSGGGTVSNHISGPTSGSIVQVGSVSGTRHISHRHP